MEVLQRTANRGSISTGYDIDNSLKLEADNSENLSKTFSSAGNRKIWTYSCWFKRTELSPSSFVDAVFSSYVDSSNRLRINFYQDRLEIFGKTASTTINVSSNAAFRDTSAWYHIVVACDTTQSTASNRVKSYINGQQITSFETEIYPAQNSEPFINSNVAHYIGQRGDVQGFASGYLAEAHFIDGQTLTPTDFGEYDTDSGIWIPKEYTGTYGTNGFYLDFEDSSSLGADDSGNGNNFTLNNITAADQATDTPTNNFCTLNPLMANAGPTNYLPITEGGTKAVNTAAAYKIANSTFGVTSGKWYWEVKATDVNGVTGIGVTMPNYWDADYTLQGCIILSDGRRYNNASATSGVTNTYTDGDIIGFALDMDATPPTLQVYKNNTSEANLMNGLSINGTGAAFLPEKEDGYFPKVVGYSANTFECNFGGYTSFSISSAASDENGYGTFEYAPPSGYYALCGKNLAEYGGTA